MRLGCILTAPGYCRVAHRIPRAVENWAGAITASATMAATAMLAWGIVGACHAGPLPSFDRPQQWEQLSGKWVFEDDGTVRQTVTAEEGDGPFLLKWTGELPEAYHLSVQIERDASLTDAKGKSLDNGYVVVRASADGREGHGFGFDRRVGRLRHFRWMRFDQSTQHRMRFARSCTANWTPWHYVAVAVNGPYYEMYYDEQNWPKYRPLEQMEAPRKVLLAGHSWEFLGHDGLVLRVEGGPGAFRDLKVVPLEQAPLPDRFRAAHPSGGPRQHKAEGMDLQDANYIFTHTRPTFEWDMAGEAMRWQDLNYVNTIYDSKNELVEREAVHGLARSWRPRRSLAPGEYRWELQVRHAHGPLRGGRQVAPFTILPQARVQVDAIEMTTPKTLHFPEAKPEFVWRWRWSAKPDHVEVWRGDERLEGEGMLAEGMFTWRPAQAQEPGLNRLELRFFRDKKPLTRYNALAVRTERTDTYTIREDGVLLRNGEIFVPLATWRDPADRNKEVPKDVNRLLKGGYNINHTYCFEGSHYWRTRKRPDREQIIEKELSGAFLQQMTEDARTFLRMCDENGVKVFLGLRRLWVARGEWDQIERFVGAVMGEPGLLAWYTYDEPNWIGHSPAHMSEVYRRIRTIDPHHPVVLYLNNWPELSDYIRGADVLCTGMHAQLPAAIHEWKQMAPYATSLTGEAHPPALWDAAHYHRGGEPRQIIGNAYVSLVGGARGFVTYYYPAIDTSYPATWAAMCEANRMLKRVMPLFLREGEELAVPSSQPRRVSYKDTDPAYIRPEDSDNAFMARARKSTDGNVYLVVFNYGSREAVWSWTVPDRLLPPDAACEALTDSGTCDPQEDRVRVRLDAFEGTVIRVGGQR